MRRIHLILFFFINLITTAASITKKQYAVVCPPKCGTHLLIETMQRISKQKIPYAGHPPGWTFIDDAIINDLFKKGFLLKTHAVYDPSNILKLNTKDIKTCCIIRDPRDQIVSAAFWIKKTPYEWPVHSQWNLDDLIDELIPGGGEIWGTIFSGEMIWKNLHGIVDFYNLYLPWCEEPFIYTTSFEKLVGPQGGGDVSDQIHEIMAIAEHMGERITTRQALNIAQKLFGNTMTFREGQIGSWKKYFLPRHVEAFKALPGANDLLITLGYEKRYDW